jgi:hypothetical protein
MWRNEFASDGPDSAMMGPFAKRRFRSEHDDKP